MKLSQGKVLMVIGGVMIFTIINSMKGSDWTGLAVETFDGIVIFLGCVFLIGGFFLDRRK